MSTNPYEYAPPYVPSYDPPYVPPYGGVNPYHQTGSSSNTGLIIFVLLILIVLIVVLADLMNVVNVPGLHDLLHPSTPTPTPTPTITTTPGSTPSSSSSPTPSTTPTVSPDTPVTIVGVTIDPTKVDKLFNFISAVTPSKLNELNDDQYAIPDNEFLLGFWKAGNYIWQFLPDGTVIVPGGGKGTYTTNKVRYLSSTSTLARLSPNLMIGWYKDGNWINITAYKRG